MKNIVMCAALACSLVMVHAPAGAEEESGLAFSHDLGRENGRLCMTNHGHTGAGSGATKAAARAAAIGSWAEFTNFEYGRAWASFSAAAGATTRYTKEASGWSADVDARPCKR